MTSNKNELLSQLSGQYILTAENQDSPEGWTTHSYNEWKLFTNQLPVVDVYNEENKWLGWCLGYPVLDGLLGPQTIILKNPIDQYDPYSDFYDRTSGKWVLILPAAAKPAFYLDPYGSLPAVYSTAEKIIAATPTLVGSEKDWDEQLMAEIGFPQKIHWLPSGLTFKKGVRRLIANHSLNLATWKVSRHWPTPDTDFSIDNNTDAAVDKIGGNIQDTISAVSKKYPLCLTITAGMDSRNVLACARNHVQNAEIITFTKENDKSPDTVISDRIANQEGLNHKFLNIQKSSPEELERWQYITGRCVAGGIWEISKTLTQLDPERIMMSGQSGEVHRGNAWRHGDTATSKITAPELLKRYKFPMHPVLIKATEEWLAEHEHYNTFVMLDLVHIEQRMSCWGALQAFGNTTSALEISPLSSRLIFQSMMRLPHKYRKKQQLPYDISRKLWPELLKHPFNEYPGIYGYFNSGIKRLKKFAKRYVRR